MPADNDTQQPPSPGKPIELFIAPSVYEAMQQAGDFPQSEGPEDNRLSYDPARGVWYIHPDHPRANELARRFGANVRAAVEQWEREREAKTAFLTSIRLEHTVPRQDRVYLSGLEDREEARRIGARSDPATRKWYVSKSHPEIQRLRELYTGPEAEAREAARDTPAGETTPSEYARLGVLAALAGGGVIASRSAAADAPTVGEGVAAAASEVSRTAVDVGEAAGSVARDVGSSLAEAGEAAAGGTAAAARVFEQNFQALQRLGHDDMTSFQSAADTARPFLETGFATAADHAETAGALMADGSRMLGDASLTGVQAAAAKLAPAAEAAGRAAIEAAPYVASALGTAGASAAVGLLAHRQGKNQVREKVARVAPWVLSPSDFGQVASRLFKVERTQDRENGKHRLAISERASGKPVLMVESDHRVSARTAMTVLHDDIVRQAIEDGQKVPLEVLDARKQAMARVRVEHDLNEPGFYGNVPALRLVEDAPKDKLAAIGRTLRDMPDRTLAAVRLKTLAMVADKDRAGPRERAAYALGAEAVADEQGRRQALTRAAEQSSSRPSPSRPRSRGVDM